MPGASFDRVADHYDDSRGGELRGRAFATAVEPWIVGPRVVELGVGTGAVAVGLHERGHRLFGFDISTSMMEAALRRVGPRLVAADVDTLPLPDSVADTALFVWVLQLVDDPADSLREAARVVRPGGRVIAILAEPENDPDDEIGAVLGDLDPLRRRGRGRDPIISSAPAELRLLHRGHAPWQEFEGTPDQQIEMIERRSYSSLFDVGDADWQRIVEPVLNRLRALPDPGRARRRRNRHPLVVWDVVERPGSGSPTSR